MRSYLAEACSGADESGTYSRDVSGLGYARLGHLAEVCSGADETGSVKQSQRHVQVRLG